MSWWWFIVWYVVFMWIMGVLFVRGANRGVIYTDRRNNEQDSVAVLTAPIWMPVAILYYIFTKGLSFIGRLASGIPFRGG